MNLFFQKDTPSKKEFDERQELVRNKGFKYAFYVLLYYNLLKMIWDFLKETEEQQAALAVPELAGFAAICISILVYASYTIWNDGYFPFREKPGIGLLTLFLLAAWNLTLGTIELLTRSSDLPISPAIRSLMIGFTGLAIIAVVLVKKIHTKHTDEEANE